MGMPVFGPSTAWRRSEFLTFCRNMDIEPDSKRPKLNDSIEAARVVDGVVLPLPRPAATLSATGTGSNAGLSATSTSLDISSLPHPLRERTRVGRRGVNDPSAPVLFWSRKVLRSEENPALDAAIYAANELRAPLLVLLHIEDRYRHNTARRQQKPLLMWCSLTTTDWLWSAVTLTF